MVKWDIIVMCYYCVAFFNESNDETYRNIIIKTVTLNLINSQLGASIRE